MKKEEFFNIIAKKVEGQGIQIDVSGVLPSLLKALWELSEGASGEIGSLEELETDHKSDLVSAINEIAGLVETPHYVVALDSTTADLKAIYDECAENLVLAKNIVFYNSNDGLYYKVNGYKLDTDVLILHTIMQGDDGLVDTIVNITSAGIISIG